jgi:hypothetical protein
VSRGRREIIYVNENMREKKVLKKLKKELGNLRKTTCDR